MTDTKNLSELEKFIYEQLQYLLKQCNASARKLDKHPLSLLRDIGLSCSSTAINSIAANVNMPILEIVTEYVEELLTSFHNGSDVKKILAQDEY